MKAIINITKNELHLQPKKSWASLGYTMSTGEIPTSRTADNLLESSNDEKKVGHMSYNNKRLWITKRVCHVQIIKRDGCRTSLI